jgi:hypothetical protein
LEIYGVVRAVHLKSVISADLLRTLAVSAAELTISQAPASTKANRDRLDDAKTVFHMGWWMKYCVCPFLSKDATFLPAQKFLDVNRPLWDLINKFFAEEFPVEAARHASIHKPLGHQLGAFAMAVLNIDLISGVHNDPSDCRRGMAASASFGEWEDGGDFGLAEWGIVIKTRPGDLTFFNSYQDKHFVTPTSGIRNSVLLFSHQSLFNFHKV